MNVTLTSTFSGTELSMLESLYVNAFPVEERRPWPLILSPEHRGEPTLYGIAADGSLVGLVTVWPIDGFVYIEHLAVDPTQRGHGIGAEAIRLVSLKYPGKPVVVEIEPPTPEVPDTMRRFEFYKRQGFKTIDPNYIQPPYAPGLPSVPLHLLATSDIDPTRVTAQIHTKVYKHKAQ